MKKRFDPKFRQLAIATAMLAVFPAAYAQEGRPDRVLPPPSLYDELMPPDKGAGAAKPATARPSVEAQSAAPAKQAGKPQVATKPVDSDQPWYNSIFAWFGGNSEVKPAQSKMMAAPSSAATKAAEAGSTRPEFAYNEGRKVIRTGYGQCVKTGWTAAANLPCEGSTLAAQPMPTKVAAVAPVSAIAPRAEPVEVRPLAPAPTREERALEPDAMSAAQPAPPAPTARPKPPVESVSLSADALFAHGSATLKPSAKQRLDALATRMTTVDYKTIRVVGHTDPTGSAQYNEKLSRRRAEAVKQYLVSRGVDAKRIATEGMGSAMPMVSEHDCSSLSRQKKIACYQRDRRVEIEVTGMPSKVGSAQPPALAKNR